MVGNAQQRGFATQELELIMKTFAKIQARLLSMGADEDGASLVEYALLLALIALVAVVAVRFFGQELSTSYTDIANSFP